MNKRPWAFWPPLQVITKLRLLNQPLPPADEETLLIGELLGKGCEQHPKHPGFAHFAVHYWEHSPYPENGIEAAKRLSYLSPDQGHLRHMPSHVYMWIGLYRESMEANIEGIDADDRYVQLSGNGGTHYLGYRLHNMYSSIWGALFAADEVCFLPLSFISRVIYQ